MQKKDQRPRILISDINHHVRDFLKRELEREGYRVCCATNAGEVLSRLDNDPAVTIVVLDSQLLFAYGDTLVEEIVRRRPSVDVLFHTYADLPLQLDLFDRIHVVEKKGSSINDLKRLIGVVRRRRGTRYSSGLKPAAAAEDSSSQELL